MTAPAPERLRRSLARGALLFRWVALAWMTVLAVTETDGFRHAPLAWATIGAAGAWTAWLTVAGRKWSWSVLWFDLALCGWLILASGIVIPDQTIAIRPFFAAAYPVSAVLLWAVARGTGAGIGAALILSGALVVARKINGVDLDALRYRHWQVIAGVTVLYLAAAVAVGFVSHLLQRTAEEAQSPTDEASQIHDSALQALTLVHERAAELAASPAPSAEEAGRLAELAGQQEEMLRNLMGGGSQEAPPARS